MKFFLNTIAAMAAIATTSLAAPILPYGATRPGSFAVATAGYWTGNSIGPYSTNLVLGNPNTQQFSGTGLQTASAAYTAIPGSTSSAQAQAQLGVLKLSSEYLFSVSGSGSVQEVAASLSDAGWADQYTISNASLTGQSGVLKFFLHVDGLLSASGWGGSTFSISVQTQPFASNFLTQFGCDSRNLPACSTPVNSNYEVSVPFVFGTSFEMMIRAIAQASMPSLIGPQPPGQAAADFQNTIYWAGISSVSIGGNVISDYSISSQSGTNYSASLAPGSEVPEPSTYLVVAAGLCLLFRKGKSTGQNGADRL